MPQLDKFALYPQVAWFVSIFLFLYIFFVYFFLPQIASGLKTRYYYLSTELKKVTPSIKGLNSTSQYIGSVDQSFSLYCVETLKLQKTSISSYNFNGLQPHLDLYILRNNAGFFVVSWSELVSRFNLNFLSSYVATKFIFWSFFWFFDL